MSEWRLLKLIRERLLGARADREGVRIDIGDDAAVLAWSGDVVTSVDSAVEGVHFRRDWLSLEQIGARSFVAALSDLAAMGSRPRGALVALALPRGISEVDVSALVDGLARASEAHGCPIVGGNLTRASEISITTTVLGDGSAHLTRSGAREGDEIFVSGEIGGSALGLALLAVGRRDAPFVERFIAPSPRIALGLQLVGHATSAIDLSDGLVSDLGHVLEASGVAGEIEVARLPIAAGHSAIAEALCLDSLELVLNGGEDYELLFTLPKGAAVPVGVTRIGRITAGAPEVTLVMPDGTRRTASSHGHDHFG